MKLQRASLARTLLFVTPALWSANYIVGRLAPGVVPGDVDMRSLCLHRRTLNPSRQYLPAVRLLTGHNRGGVCILVSRAPQSPAMVGCGACIIRDVAHHRQGGLGELCPLKFHGRRLVDCGGGVVMDCLLSASKKPKDLPRCGESLGGHHPGGNHRAHSIHLIGAVLILPGVYLASRNQ